MATSIATSTPSIVFLYHHLPHKEARLLEEKIDSRSGTGNEQKIVDYLVIPGSKTAIEDHMGPYKDTRAT